MQNKSKTNLQELVVWQGKVTIVSFSAQRADDGCAGRHVDARCQGARGKHQLQQPPAHGTMHHNGTGRLS